MGCASFLFTDFETSTGTATVRVRIADWISARQRLTDEEETQPEKRQRPLLEKERKMT
jgi:hypothetical protein